MQVGFRVQGRVKWGKWCVERHQKTCKRTLNAMEKEYETRVRRAGKRACQERD